MYVVDSMKIGLPSLESLDEVLLGSGGEGTPALCVRIDANGVKGQTLVFGCEEDAKEAFYALSRMMSVI